VKAPTVYYYIEKRRSTKGPRATVTVKIVHGDRALSQASAEVDFEQLKLFNQELFSPSGDTLKTVIAKSER